MRRLPVYLLVDTSGSMKGEPIAAANNGLQAMMASLIQDPAALESVAMSVITFDREVNELVPLTPLEEIRTPLLSVPDSGPTLMGKALEFLMDRVRRDVVPNSKMRKGDWRPLLFLITDGKPSDLQLYKTMCADVKSYKFARIVACAAGQSAKTEPLKELTSDVYSLATMDTATFSQFFQWVSQSIAQGSTNAGRSVSLVNLPPPPAEINLVS